MIKQILNISFFKYFENNLPLDIKIFSIIVYLLPIALITGPAIPDIILSLVASYFFAKLFIMNLWKIYFKNKFTYFFLFFCFYGIVRSIFSDQPFESMSLEGSVFYFRYIFFSLAIWHLLDMNKNFTYCLILICTICLFVVGLDALYQYFYGQNILGYNKFNEHRLTGFFNDEPIVGRYLAYTSTLLFVLIYQNKNLDLKLIVFSISILVFSEIIVFLSGERAPLFYLTLFSILIVVFIKKFRLARIIGLAISIFSIFLIMQINPTSKERIVDLTVDQMSETSVPFLPYSELHERHYITALKMFLDKPLVGIGTNLFRIKCKDKKYFYKEGGCTTHPHHFYFQILAELGIIGVFFILLFNLYLSLLLLKQFITKIYPKNIKDIMPFKEFVIVILLFVYFWPLIPHMSFYNNWNNIFLFIPLGYFLQNMYKRKSY